MENINYYKNLPASPILYLKTPEPFFNDTKKISVKKKDETKITVKPVENNQNKKHKKLKIYDKDDTLPFKKHKGETVSSVIINDRFFLIWLYYNLPYFSLSDKIIKELDIDCSEINKPGSDNALGEKVIAGIKTIERANQVNEYDYFNYLKFGKYKGEVISQVVSDDPTYLIWLYYNISSFSLSNTVLDKIRISENKIKKPGINASLGETIIEEYLKFIHKKKKCNFRQKTTLIA